MGRAIIWETRRGRVDRTHYVVRNEFESALSNFAELTRACPRLCRDGSRAKGQPLYGLQHRRISRPRQVFAEILFEQRSTEHLEEPVACLRRATTEEVDLVARACCNDGEETGVTHWMSIQTVFANVAPDGFNKGGMGLC